MNEENTQPEKRSILPSRYEIKRAIVSFSHSEQVVFLGLVALAIISAVFTIVDINRLFMSEVPTYGGAFTEGIVGTPRFVNPVLALSDADRDLTSVVYSGLLRKTSDGGYIPDLAEKYEISKDGLVYTFTLRDNTYFHDGIKLTADDVEYTIARAKDPLVKSPKRPNWEGVSVQKIDDRTISFVLKQPYAQFLNNTTLGILPKHLWREVSPEEFPYSDYNLNAIGSGPYEVDSVNKSRAGIPSSVSLSAFSKFALGRPYIETINFKFYGNEEELVSAWKSGNVNNINAITPEEAGALRERGAFIKQYPLPRVYGVFFNQSQAPVLSDIAVRKALSEAVDRVKVVNTVLYGYGTPLFDPIPRVKSTSLLGNTDTSSINESRAKKILEDNGWDISTTTGTMTKKVKKDVQTISFSLSTADNPELRAVAEIVKNNWEKIGVRVDIKVFEQGDLNQNIIRPRKYDSLLFGEVIGEDSDPYAFWHSSQRNDPGLNIALYANSKVDKILEDARGTLDQTERAKKYDAFETELESDSPAVFIYSPDFIYVLSSDIKGMDLGELTVPAERFLNVYQWYKDTDWVWKIFTRKSQEKIN